MSIDLILLILSAICLALAALGVDLTNGKVGLFPLGVLFFVLTFLI